MIGTYCKGEECPIKNQCQRYTKRGTVTQSIGGYNVIRKCTLQKRFLQDPDNINPDSKKSHL